MAIRAKSRTLHGASGSLISDVINHAANVASNRVMDFAGTFVQAEDYEPLEHLAEVVHGEVVRQCCTLVNRRRKELGG